jgi:hypothetical protein
MLGRSNQNAADTLRKWQSSAAGEKVFLSKILFASDVLRVSDTN